MIEKLSLVDLINKDLEKIVAGQFSFCRADVCICDPEWEKASLEKTSSPKKFSNSDKYFDEPDK